MTPNQLNQLSCEQAREQAIQQYRDRLPSFDLADAVQLATELAPDYRVVGDRRWSAKVQPEDRRWIYAESFEGVLWKLLLAVEETVCSTL